MYSSFQTKWEMLVADAWDDAELKQRLLDDPVTVLRERGIRVPQGLQITVVEDTADVEHFVLPSEPAEDEISYEHLEAVAGGGAKASRGCISCYGCHASQSSRGCAASKMSRGCRGCRP